jgi:hypothetical protein
VLLCLGLLLSEPLINAGCATNAPRISRSDPAGTQSLVRTSVLMVSAGDLNTFRDGTQSIDVDGTEMRVKFPGTAEEQKAFAARLELERGVRESQSGAFLVLAAVWIVERVVDALVKEIRQRASEYSAEYAASSSGVLVPANSNSARVEGIIVRRDRFAAKADGTTEYQDNEMCVVFRLAEVPRGASGSGLYNATPIYLKVTKPMARTSFFGDCIPKMTTTIKCEMNSVGPAGRGTSNVLNYAFIATRLPVGPQGMALVNRIDLNRQSELFALPLGSSTPVGANIKVTFAEVDEGHDAKLLEGIAGLLDKNKPQIVDVVKGTLSGP